MGSSSPLILEISSDEEFDFGAIQRGSDGGGGGEFGAGDCLDWLSEFFGEVGGDKKVVENNVDENDASDDVVVVSEVKPKKIKKLGFVGLKPVDKETVDRKIDVCEDDDDDCVILDGDPAKPVAVVKEKVGNRDSVDDMDDELEIVGEKGEVACRDFPHSRHLCVKFPFDSTYHAAHCSQCHCYVCDSLAPCSRWGTGKTSHDHCHASDMFNHWKTERKNMKQGKNPTPSLPQPVGSLAKNHFTRPTIIRPCSGRSVNFNIPTNVVSQLKSNSSGCVMPRGQPRSQAAFPQIQQNTNIASRSQRPNIGSPGASSFTPRVGFKRPGGPGTFPSSKRANTSQIPGNISVNAYKMPQIRLVREVHGSNQPNVSSQTAPSVSPQVRFPASQNVAPANSILPRRQLATPRPYSNGFLGDSTSRQTQARTASEPPVRSQFLQGSAIRPAVDGSFQNMHLAWPVYPNQHAIPPSPSQSDSLPRPIAQYTSRFTSMGHAQNGVDVVLNKNFSVGSTSVHLPLTELEMAGPADNSQYHSTVKDDNLPQLQQQTIGSVDSASLNPNHTDASLSPEGTKENSLELGLNGWLPGHSSSEELFSVPLSPVWNMYSPEPASLGGTDIPFDF